MRFLNNALKLSAGSMAATSRWVTVRTTHKYQPGEMVVIATPIAQTEANLVAAVRNIGTNSFEVRLLSADGDQPIVGHVSWFAVAVGQHDLGAQGRIEASRVAGTTVDHPGILVGQPYRYALNYELPVIVGQIIDRSDSGDKWTTFWASGAATAEPPNRNTAFVGQAAGNPEGMAPGELCVVVLETGTYEVNGIALDARLLDNVAEPAVIRTDVAPMLAAASIAGSKSTDGAWPSIVGQSVEDAFNKDAIELRLTSIRGGDALNQEGEAIALVVINGERDAARFAKQAAWGGHDGELRSLFQTGYAEWIAAQRAEPVSVLLPYMEFIADVPFDALDPDIRPAVIASAAGHNRHDQHINLTTPWLRNVVWEPDQLRQRIAFCLSQIFVVSGFGNELSVAGAALAEYYDNLATHALGNFRDVLSEVTYSGVMATYLTYVANRPPSSDGTRQPDENYAREIMQLMTIGLWELNIDGSLATADGRDGPEFVQRDGEVGIPTYTNVEINVLARVFTGLFHDAQINGAQAPYGASRRGNGQDDSIANSYLWSGKNIAATVDFSRSPLAMFEAEHDHDQKELFGTTIAATAPANTITSIPADRSTIVSGGLKQIEDALDILFAHPNVGPFIGRRLIQSLVTSNPSPAYIQRAAETFNDDGNGERGNLHAVVQAILLDPEARGYFDNQPTRGKLVEPLVRIASIAKGFRFGSGQNRVFDAIDAPVYARGNLQGLLEQGLLRSPSVFNFFAPDFEIEPELRAPEAQILNARSVPALERVLEELMFDSLPPVARTSWFAGDFAAELSLLARNDEAGLEQLIDWLDLRIAHGQLSDLARQAIRSAVGLLRQNPDAPALDQFKVAAILAAVSPDASVLV